MRKKFDQYYTPTLAVKQFLSSLDFSLSGSILEPCNGEGAISRELKEIGCKVISNDLDLNNPATYHLDLSLPENWDAIEDADFVVTNPPFSLAPTIVKLAYQKAKKGVIALLRLSFVEPCQNRVEFLLAHPPDQMLITPRISFLGKGTDSTTTAWFIWLKDEYLRSQVQHPIRVLPKI